MVAMKVPGVLRERGWRELREVADVVIRLGDADVEFRVAGHAEGLACGGFHPFVAARELVLAGTGDAFHDFGRAGVEGQAGGQHDADGFFRAVGQRETVADAFAVKVHIGLGRDAHVVDFFGSHEKSFEQGKRCIRQAGRASGDFRAGRAAPPCQPCAVQWIWPDAPRSLAPIAALQYGTLNEV